MSRLVDRSEMESVFGADELVTPDAAQLAGVTHEPTRAFLRDVGLPIQEGWFEADQRLVDGDLRIGGDGWQRVAARYPNSGLDMSSWLSLGGIGMDDVSVDAATGVVHCIPEDGSPHVLNSDLDALAYFLCALEKERPAYDPEADSESMDPEGAEERLLALMRRADPVALEYPESCWFTVLRNVRNHLDYC